MLPATDNSIDDIIIKNEESKQELEATNRLLLRSNPNTTEQRDEPIRRRVLKPKPYKRIGKTKYTDQDIKNLILYVVDEDYSVAAAARKVNMDRNSANRFYHTYLKNGKTIPTREDRRTPDGLYEEHKVFLTNLYKENKGLTLPKVLKAIKTEFPELEVRREKLKSFLRTQMPDEYNMTVRFKRKFFDHHEEFIQNIIDTEPNTTIYNIYKKFTAQFTDASLSKSALSSQIHKYFGNVYKSPQAVQKMENDKFSPQYMDFIIKTMGRNKKMSLRQAIVKLGEEFPNQKITYSAISGRLKRDHYEFYKKHVYDRHYKPKRENIKTLKAVRILYK